jgi:hypothetical protein
MKEYKTKDIFEGAFLHSQKNQLLRLEPDNHYFWFVFEEKEKCERLSSAYWSGSAIGNIKDFVNSYKTLKDLVFSKTGR